MHKRIPYSPLGLCVSQLYALYHTPATKHEPLLFLASCFFSSSPGTFSGASSRIRWGWAGRFHHLCCLRNKSAMPKNPNAQPECPRCGKPFKNPSRLARHDNDVHTKRIIYSCKKCSHISTQKSNMKVHQKVHEKAALKIAILSAPPVNEAAGGFGRHWADMPAILSAPANPSIDIQLPLDTPHQFGDARNPAQIEIPLYTDYIFSGFCSPMLGDGTPIIHSEFGASFDSGYPRSALSENEPAHPSEGVGCGCLFSPPQHLSEIESGAHTFAPYGELPSSSQTPGTAQFFGPFDASAPSQPLLDSLMGRGWRPSLM
ncbi:hypothetical protein BOTBODRAFT_222980 [Botryobasidium botryosum FD-172 SS1]|uniref:C2H2-type domain-containing protein n=1 Tax=Botryobasidium botryosum (strain FD-172 SS1) TaxID=930990 RepID=A0A067MML9_BOTB1|nr:hypothetical protein BOTBODRAFT_222980 [Botryobasidium botryosum FD-172 SS1]